MISVDVKPRVARAPLTRHGLSSRVRKKEQQAKHGGQRQVPGVVHSAVAERKEPVFMG